MTREEAKELLPIIKAFADGKKVEFFNDVREWEDSEYLEFSRERKRYRIKKEPKYRPFKNKEECWNEMLKHQPFGWVKNKETEDFSNISNIYKSAGIAKVFLVPCVYKFTSLLNEFTFIDGTPFGIKEE